jgi:hypothetical protein
VHQVCDWYGSAVAKFGWMRDARRANTRCGLQPTSNKASGQNPQALRVGAAPAPRGVAGSLKGTQPFASPAPCEDPAALPTLLYQSQTWCTGIAR